MTLEQLLTLLVAGGGIGGTLVYFILNKIPKYVAMPEDDLKRWIAAAFSSVIAAVAWGIGVGLAIFPAPVGDWRSWVTVIGNVLIGAFAAFGTASLEHTKTMKAERMRLRGMKHG